MSWIFPMTVEKRDRFRGFGGLALKDMIARQEKDIVAR
jgi:hypothetical protein